MSRKYSIQAIPTTYNDTEYLSRLEARWAVFFDELHIPFNYEPEGFQLPSGWYVPDFWLPEQDVFIEVKPTSPTHHEKQKAQDLAIASNHDVLIFYGPPLDCITISDYEGAFRFEAEPDIDLDGTSRYGFEQRFMECSTCGRIDIGRPVDTQGLSCECSFDYDYPGDKSFHILDAAQKARNFNSRRYRAQKSA